MWDKNGGKLFDTSEIFELIKSYKDKIEGMTFLGGEPLEQIEAVTEIAKNVQNIGLSVILFTGYNYQDKIQEEKFQALIKYVDILIDGNFKKDKLDYSRAWVGSSNQNYYFLTDKYDKSVIYKYKNKIEVRITKDNKVLMTGMGDVSKLKTLLR